MSISKRFMVRGKRTDTGKRVVGWLVEKAKVRKSKADIVFAIRSRAGGTFSTHEIDPATIEPIAIKPTDVQWVKDPAGYVGYCPNCTAKIDDDEVYGSPNYCKYCGQRLDWSEVE